MSGERLVYPGLLFGCLLVILLGYITTSAAPIHKRQTEIISSQPVAGSLNVMNAADSLSIPPECRVSQKYPKKVRQWCNLITQFSLQYNLPADLVAAVIWQESGGNPLAYSRSGAVGLMQIMPRDGLAATFTCANGPCFTNRPSRKQLEDPLFNVKFGTRMLAGLVKSHDDYREALKAYGPLDAGYSYADKILKIYKKYRND